MDRSQYIRSVAAHIEARRPDLKGLTIADVPELAELRTKARRDFYRNANWSGALAVFNVVLALAPGYSLWPLSTAAAALSVTTVVFCEGKARAMSRQLRRPAIEQIARDLVGLVD